MKIQHDLARLDWTLAGWTPWVWRQQRSIESGVSLNAEVLALPASVPGSVQGALRQAGIIPDWNVGLNTRECEWVENRHWIFTTRIPDPWLMPGMTVRLRALGLDYSGWILVNGRLAGEFRGSFVPHIFDLTSHLRTADNTLHIVFDCPPRWLGQIGYTSRMTDWKPRFNYFWDWTSRLVQTGVWDDLWLEITDGDRFLDLDVSTDARPSEEVGVVWLQGLVSGARGHSARVELCRNGETLYGANHELDRLVAGLTLDGLPIELWWPNGHGAQPLYELRCTLLDRAGGGLDEVTRRIAFKHLVWATCSGAPAEADPWLCMVNDRPTFLQGVNWTPIRPNFADVTAVEYRSRLETYRDMGCTMLRVWGGAFLEREIFYDICDEFGMLVWQEMPLSSSGLDNWPPEDPSSIEEMAEIAESYVRRRRHHVSLALWCGGNELQGPPGPDSRPITRDHPLIARLADVVGRLDPGRRFLPSSSSGPSFGASEEDFGKGVHWDVHGPWHAEGDLDGDWTRYWEHDDALFRSEVGIAGASPVDVIRGYRGGLSELPATRENPLWRRTSWWIDWPSFVEEHGREPKDLEEFVAWSQERQRRALCIAAAASRRRFPGCGGFLIWMGHDSFPCTANTSILDFHGRPKPAAESLARVFRAEM